MNDCKESVGLQITKRRKLKTLVRRRNCNRKRSKTPTAKSEKIGVSEKTQPRPAYFAETIKTNIVWRCLVGRQLAESTLFAGAGGAKSNMVPAGNAVGK